MLLGMVLMNVEVVVALSLISVFVECEEVELEL
jgi:hypothetical protein